MTPQPSKEAMEAAAEVYRQLRSADVEHLFSSDQEIVAHAIDSAFSRGRAAGLEMAAELLEPHKPNCGKWECGNCSRAGAVRALAQKEGG